MKFIKSLILPVSLLMAVLVIASCSKSKSKTDEVEIDPEGAPPKVWKEHWGYHHQVLNRVYYDDHLALYYDNNMDRSITWLNKAMSDSWAYVIENYGAFGTDKRLFVICHKTVDTTNNLGGGHPASYMDASHDNRNVIDNGLGSWTYPTGEQIGLPIHEIGHIVANASFGRQHEDQNIWGDSKFAEIFVYDVLLHIGREDEASREYYQMQNTYDTFPRPNTQWFKNWFYPIYKKYGGGKLLSRYFEILSKNVENRDLNWGEFIHFWSGAAGANLKEQATIAFGWPDEWETQFRQAQKDFPNVKYNY
ncbi:hypothetical protein GCM10023149_06950 [Mucilaginibacter gynuensis]|uniref:Peptidase n=1 Tax=Mucilaginibacter gynuensis TaxID=1302236 RepID=A0ABP8FVX9_9SPHI